MNRPPAKRGTCEKCGRNLSKQAAEAFADELGCLWCQGEENED